MEFESCLDRVEVEQSFLEEKNGRDAETFLRLEKGLSKASKAHEVQRSVSETALMPL